MGTSLEASKKNDQRPSRSRAAWPVMVARETPAGTCKNRNRSITIADGANREDAYEDVKHIRHGLRSEEPALADTPMKKLKRLGTRQRSPERGKKGAVPEYEWGLNWARCNPSCPPGVAMKTLT